MGVYETTQNNLKKQKIMLSQMQQELQKLPEGTLQRRIRQNRVEYYTRVDGTQLYIPKSQHSLVNDLKRRRVLETAESIAKGNIKAMERLLKEYEPINFDEIERNLPLAYRGLEPVTPEFNPGPFGLFGEL